jgi:hypothetical protein
MNKVVISLFAVALSLTIIGCAAKKPDQAAPQKPAPSQPQAPDPASGQAACRQKCEDEYNKCFAICDADPSDMYCSIGGCDLDWDDCVSQC